MKVAIYKRPNKPAFKRLIMFKAFKKATPIKPKLIKNPHFKALLNKTLMSIKVGYFFT
jgi:hypothetical protein